MNRFLVFLCLVGLSACSAKYPVVANEHNSYEDNEARDVLNDVLNLRPAQVDLGAEGDLGFAWSNCGDKSKDPIHVISLSASPDPITIPGSLNISADVNVMQDIATASSLALKVYKKLFGVFIEVPCIDNLGSCTYSNPCSLLAKIKCPPVLEKYGINCRCPIKKKEYKIPPTSITLPTIKLPSFIENGDYKIKATLMNGSSRLACYQVTASLKTK